MADDVEDEDRAKILSRRAKLVAAALAGLMVSCGDSGSGGGPTACLSVDPTGGGGVGGVGGTGGTGGTGGAQACLSMQPTGGGGVGAAGLGGAGAGGIGGAGGTGGG